METLKNWVEHSISDSDQGINWDFSDTTRDKTSYATHGIHSYSSKYIPQIPNALIKLYSNKDDIVLDNFVGSGTTLVEARLLGRNSIGVDLNRYACLISMVKTIELDE